MKDLKEFSYPQNIGDAVRRLHEAKGKAAVIAGGTSLTLTKDRGVETLVDISRLGLDYVKQENGALVVGACATAHMLSESPELLHPCLLALGEASKTAGPHGVRAALTIGGNVVQCYPWSDLPVALLAINASVRIAGNTSREVSITDFLQRHPSKTLEPGEIVKEFVLPIARKSDGVTTASSFVKISRTVTDYALTTAAVLVDVERVARNEEKEDSTNDSDNNSGKKSLRIKDLRIAIGAVRPMPVLVEDLGSLCGENHYFDEDWIEKIGDTVLSQVGPIADMRASSEYRNRLIKIASVRAVQTAVKRAEEVVQ